MDKNKFLIINADDLGFTPGINAAIKKAHLEGYLSHASMMCNTRYFEEALTEVLPFCPLLKIGAHINLTCGIALHKESVFAKNGKLKNNFVKLLLMRKSAKVLQDFELEIEAQILKLKENGITIQHIDGHEHIHIIPSINKVIRKLADKHDIPRIREINESLITSMKYNLRTASFANILKLILLQFLSIFNRNKNKVQFYSILNTCAINEVNLFNYLAGKNAQYIEIMLHPSVLDLDRNVKNLEPRFMDFLRSKFRTQELELCFNKKFDKYV